MAAKPRPFPPALSSDAASGVNPAWLEPRLGRPSLRILDVRADAPPDLQSGPRLRAAGRASRERRRPHRGPAAAYVEGHVPGAIPLDVRAVLFDASGEVVSAPELALAMSELGVGDGDTVVLVDEGRPETALAAARALARYGHRDVHVLEGGFARWLGEGRAVSRDVVRLPPASYTAKVTR